MPPVVGAPKEQLPDAFAAPGFCEQLPAYFQSLYVCTSEPAGARAIQSVDVGFATLKLTVTELPGDGFVGLTLMSVPPDGGGGGGCGAEVDVVTVTGALSKSENTSYENIRNSYEPPLAGTAIEQLPEVFGVVGRSRVQLPVYLQSLYVDMGSPARARAIQLVVAAFGTLKLTVTELPGAAVAGLTLRSTLEDGGGGGGGCGVVPVPDPTVT